MGAPGWEEIEAVDGFDGVKRQFERDLSKELGALPKDQIAKDNLPKGLALPMGLLVVWFFVSNMIFDSVLPDNFFGVILHIPLFFAAMIGGAYVLFNLFKERIIALFMRGQQRFLARSRALSAFAERAGFEYVPSPGGAPPTLKAFAKWGGSPKELKDIVELLDDHGGLDEALEAAKTAGVMAAPATVIGGNEEQKALYANQATSARLEDGFTGKAGGADFAAFEWVESVDEAPDIHHLVVVLTAPVRLHGLTQFRTRRTSWPRNTLKADMEAVDLGPEIFTSRFKLRAQDQTEARAIFNPAVIERVADFAHGDKIKAAAFEDHLVIDFEGGGDRFNAVNLITGEWTDESVRQSIADIQALRKLVEEAAHAFMLRG